MAGSSRVVPVDTTPVLLTSSPSDRRSDQSIGIVPRDGTVTVGFDDQVAVDAGMTVGTAGDVPQLDLDLQPGEKIWAVAAATVQVAVLELGL